MKSKILIFMVFLMVFTTSFSTCKKENDIPIEKVCDVENPLKDLPWLKEIVDRLIEEDKTSFFKPHARIFQCNYIEGTGFLLEMNVASPDGGYYFRNCEGEHLCFVGGVAGFSCKEFDIDFKNIKLIYEINSINF